MGLKAHTVATSCTVSGVGLHSGAQVTMTFLPSETGRIEFVRTDSNNASVLATAKNVVSTTRGTTIGQDDATISTIEHVMAVLAVLNITSVRIEMDGPECPIFDGSSKEIFEVLKGAGLKETDREVEVLNVQANLVFKDEESGAEYLVVPAEKPQFTALVDYGSNVLPPQHAILKDLSDFEKEIAPARTFCFVHELEYLLDNDLIKGGGLNNAIVFAEGILEEAKQAKLAKAFGQPELRVNETGMLNNTELRFPNEPARHKLLDLVGDLALANVRINGHVIATRPGHAANTRFSQFIADQVKENRKPQAPKINLEAEPLLDVNGIMGKLPHRPPFLFIDKIYELSDTHVVGVKNVTMNEYFFKGHFPGAPVMPGVILIEAMAQVGGILVMSTYPDPENYLTYFMKVDGVKFRRMVVPGDTVVFHLDLLSPIRRGLCHMKGIAYVGNDMVMEGEMMARIARKESVE